jgi:hypothetical protein
MSAIRVSLFQERPKQHRCYVFYASNKPTQDFFTKNIPMVEALFVSPNMLPHITTTQEIMFTKMCEVLSTNQIIRVNNPEKLKDDQKIIPHVLTAEQEQKINKRRTKRQRQRHREKKIPLVPVEQQRFILARPKESILKQGTPPSEVKQCTPLQEVKQCAPLQEVKQCAPLQEVKQCAPLKEVKQCAPLQEVKQCAPLSEVKQCAPLSEFKKCAPLQEVKQRAPLQEVKQCAQLQEVKQCALLQEVKQCARLSEVKQRAPLSEFKKCAPLQEVKQCTPLQEVKQRAPSQEVKQCAPILYEVQEPFHVCSPEFQCTWCLGLVDNYLKMFDYYARQVVSTWEVQFEGASYFFTS